MAREIRLNAFDMNCVGHQSPGLWAHPRDRSWQYKDLEYWTDLAKILERGKFDGLFIADVLGIYDVYNGNGDAAIRQAAQVPVNDPLSLIAPMALVTEHLGFGLTASLSFEHPYPFARRLSTLDHLTKGRIGWNIVTSYLPNAARNFGHATEVVHDHRYEIADEYLDVLYKLWEGSWDDDAVIQDREQRVYTDPQKVRYINHVGEHFSVAGPHLCQPSRQRTPVLFQATGSPAGIEFAGRHAEVVFTGGLDTREVRANIQAMRNNAIAHERDPAGLKFIVMAGVIVGRTDEEVSRKLDSYRQLMSVEASLAHAQSAIDLTAYPKDALISDLIALKVEGWESLQRYKPEWTVGTVLAQFSGFNRERFFVAGTPTVVADEIEKWLDVDGIDGINLRQYLSFETARDFIELVIPELRRRGRFRERYNEGETLRERLFGAGQTRLPDDHFGARYRDPALLQQPAKPLRFTR